MAIALATTQNTAIHATIQITRTAASPPLVLDITYQRDAKEAIRTSPERSHDALGPGDGLHSAPFRSDIASMISRTRIWRRCPCWIRRPSSRCGRGE